MLFGFGKANPSLKKKKKIPALFGCVYLFFSLALREDLRL